MQVNINLRNDFGKLDPMVLVSPLDVASVIGAPTVGAVYTALNRGQLPEPLIRGNRRIRWTVGQIREHIHGLEVNFLARQAAKRETSEDPPIRKGRPRASEATPDLCTVALVRAGARWGYSMSNIDLQFMSKPQLVTHALFLALTASSEETMQQCSDIAESFAIGLTTIQLDACKYAALQMADGNIGGSG